jgi:formate-dependent nitrite reductase membrane component NrfD
MDIEESVYTQRIWGWQITTYLFLAGIGAGAYIIGFIFNLAHPEFVILPKVAVILGAPLVIIGVLFLIADLGRKTLFPLAFSQPLSSWIARGTIIITVFIILDLVHIGLWIWPSTLLENLPGLLLSLWVITAIFAVLTLIYTGLVLGAAKPIHFWNTSLLPILFLASGIFTGIMGIASCLIAYTLFAEVAIEQLLMVMARYVIFITIVEAIIISFYLWRTHQVIAARTSVRIVTRGHLAVTFWNGVVVAGLLIPLAFAIYYIYLPIANPVSVLVLAIVVSIIGLIGGFILKYIVVAGGTRTLLNVKGVLVLPPDIYRARFVRKKAW